MFTNAVFQGGGVKGIALVGALQKIEESGVKFSAVAGASAGAIVAALYAAGYTAQELKQLLEETNFDSLLDPPRLQPLAFLRRKGLYRGRGFYSWVYRCLERKGKRAFRDLHEIELKVIASDLTNRELMTFDRASTPAMAIAEAVRMSMSIPLFFEPYRYGERLIVDGGVLSNYPIGVFPDADRTVGFKLVSRTTVVPTAPDSWAGYLVSLINTMMDAHDKEDERQAGHKNTIHIDNGGIPTTKFDLTPEERALLFNNGYYAASQFLKDKVEVLRNQKDNFIRVDAPFGNPLTVEVPAGLAPNELIRVSISGLIRIRSDNRFLLVHGDRLDQFQPVGGVFKRLPRSEDLMRRLHVLDDDKLPIDDESRDDLRVRVPLSSLPEFLKWYRAERGREVTPEREFREEVVHTGIVPPETFGCIFYERLRTHVRGIGQSHRFNCWELLVAEIYELDPTPDQTRVLRDLQGKPSDRYIWCEEALIRTKGYDLAQRKEVARISDSSLWLLDQPEDHPANLAGPREAAPLIG